MVFPLKKELNAAASDEDASVSAPLSIYNYINSAIFVISSTGWPFSARNVMRVSRSSVQIVSSAIISVKFSTP